MPDLKFIALVFAVILLIVVGVRQSIKKAQKRVVTEGKQEKKPQRSAKPALSEEQFNKSWKNLSYLLLMAAAGSLYMTYIAVKSALTMEPGTAWVYWIDAGSSFAAAIASVILWAKKTKSMVILYFGFTLIPIVLFMSIKGFKLNALIHLFPLILVYFVLKPVWESMKN